MKIQIALATLKPSQYREHIKNWDRNRFKEVFGGKFRTEPLRFHTATSVPAEKIDKRILDWFAKHGYEEIDYLKGIAKKVGEKNGRRFSKLLPADLHAVFEEDGRARTKQFGDVRITEYGARAQVLKNMGRDFAVIISRHPYDMIDGLIGKGWRPTSYAAKNKQDVYLPADMKFSLMAYIIEGNDVKIQKPIGRFWIRPYISKSGEWVWYPDAIIYPRGIHIPEAQERALRWLRENLNKVSEGEYTRHPRVYGDGLPKTISYK